jgi:adenosylcobinamide kinase / adenosylcobinamide-phosphate guanylyltransferase
MDTGLVDTGEVIYIRSNMTDKQSKKRQLVLGAARSGKTNHAIVLAQSLSSKPGCGVTYVATAQALDPEMTKRIQLHRAERPESWSTLEAPRDLAQALRSIDGERIVLIDCLTLWLSNALLADFDEEHPTRDLPAWQRERGSFLQWLGEFKGTVLIVSNEVGAGIVPLSALARRFQDEQGRINQAVAAICDAVTLVVAGIPLVIKPSAR